MKATLKANKALNVNDLVHTASANVNDSKVFAVNRLAFNRLFARSFITSNLAVTSDDNIKSQIDMAVPTNVDAKTPMTVTSDYSNFAKYVNVKDATVYENGKNVTLTIDGQQRSFDMYGNLVRNQYVWINSENKEVYYDANGNMVRGWQTIDGHKQYFDPTTGAQVKSATVTIDGKQYTFDGIGDLVD